MTFREYKVTKNADGSPQTREYEIAYGEMPIVFDLFFRFYEDMTRALLGEQVYVPNTYAMFDRDVASMAYIYRLDEPDELEKQKKLARTRCPWRFASCGPGGERPTTSGCRSRRTGSPRPGAPSQSRDGDLGGAREADGPGRGMRKVDDAAADIGAAIVDPHHDRTAVPLVHDPDPRAEGQRLVRGRESMRVEFLAVRGAPSLKARPVPGGQAREGRSGRERRARAADDESEGSRYHQLRSTHHNSLSKLNHSMLGSTSARPSREDERNSRL